MRHIEAYSSFKNETLSENLSYHLNEGIGILESVFRLYASKLLALGWKPRSTELLQAKSDYDYLQDQLLQAKSDYDYLQAQLLQAKVHLEAITHSRIWRISKPYRLLCRYFKNL